MAPVVVPQPTGMNKILVEKYGWDFVDGTAYAPGTAPVPAAPVPGGAFPDGGFADGEVPIDGEAPGGAFPDGGFADGEVPGGAFQDGGR